jgi:hypothetical protein
MEPLPTDPGDRRLMRGGMLCKALAARGHEVTWFTSTFDHYAKRQRMARSGTLAVSDNYRIELLRAPGYRRNGSPFRMWHNWRFARAFLDFARHSAQRPDVIVTDVPTTEAAQAAVLVGRRWGRCFRSATSGPTSSAASCRRRQGRCCASPSRASSGRWPMPAATPRRSSESRRAISNGD